MKYGSLCSGVGGLDLAVEAVFGYEAAWQSEIDKDASKVLASHWPDVPNLGDLRAVGWSEVEPVELICAGVPCQPVSHAGKRKGEDDERWLWDDVLRIVGELRPRRVVFENPRGIASWLPAILYRLAQLGYVGRYGLFTAAEVGACHRRERFFIVAHTLRSAECQHAREPLGEEEQGRRVQPFDSDGPTGLGDGLPAADADDGLLRDGRGCVQGQTPSRERSASEPDRGPANHAEGVPAADTMREGRKGSRPCVEAEPFVARMPDGTTRDYTPAMRRHEAVLGRPWPEPLLGKSLNGDFCEWMMMFPEGWLSGVSNTAKKRLAGNAVCPPQAEAAIRALTH